MLAAVLKESGADLTFAQVTTTPPAQDEVLVRTVAAGVCHTDLSVIRGHRRVPMPCVPGHEAAGVVEAVGEDVDHLRPGDHVVACLSVFCGACRWCVAGKPALCDQQRVKRAAGSGSRLMLDGEPLGAFGQIGAFAEQLLVHRNALVKIDPAVPLEAAAVLGCAVVTGLGAVFHTARVTPGETVAVLGCGGVGLNCIQGARLAGAGQIIAIDRDPDKLELARSFGATATLVADADLVERTLDLSAGGVDHAFEAVGMPETVTLSFAILARGGTSTVVGALPTDTRVELPGADLALGKTLRGCRMGSNRFQLDIPNYLDLYAQGRLRLDELVSVRMPFDRLSEALTPPAGTARVVLTFAP
jgi:S-(hydroxymethyl)glutathione dehydrogenase/alcohol dehydrogenase